MVRGHSLGKVQVFLMKYKLRTILKTRPAVYADVPNPENRPRPSCRTDLFGRNCWNPNRRNPTHRNHPAVVADVPNPENHPRPSCRTDIFGRNCRNPTHRNPTRRNLPAVDPDVQGLFWPAPQVVRLKRLL